MRRTLANVTSSVLATKPLSDNLLALLPHRDAVSDSNAALNYYRLDAQNRMIFGGRASYMIPDNPAVIGRDLQRRMASVFPELSDYDIETIWSGSYWHYCQPHSTIWQLICHMSFRQGFSGHGVALSGMAGKILAHNILGDQTKPLRL